jgi:hypothetical protein
VVSRNALQHGLASNPGRPARTEVAKLAKLFSETGGKNRPDVYATNAAAAFFQLSRLCKAHKDLLDPVWTKFEPLGGTVPPETLSDVVDALVRLERYERRAFSLRLRALRLLRRAERI